MRFAFFCCLILLTACATRQHTGELYNVFKSSRYVYVDTLHDLSIPFDSKRVFLNSPSHKILKNEIGVSAFDKLLGKDGTILFYNQRNSVFSIQYCVAVLYSNSKVFNSTDAVPFREEIINLRLLRDTSYTLGNSQYLTQVLDYRVRTKGGKEIRFQDFFIHLPKYTLRMMYGVPESADVYAEESFFDQMPAIVGSSELRKIHTTYWTQLKGNINNFPTFGAINLFKDSYANYLLPIDVLNRLRQSVPYKDSVTKEKYASGLKMMNSFAHDYRQSSPLGHQAKLPVDSNYMAYPATARIYAEARKHRLILLNEAHTDPRSRMFASYLLDSLYVLGYKTLLMEGLGEADLMKRGFPIQSSGIYTSEPEFANLIRHALKLGFNVLPYEPEITNKTSERELKLAQNIVHVLDSLPNDKVLVYAGHGHIRRENGLMADILDSLGTDPFFTINQAVNDEGLVDLRALADNQTEPVIYYNAYREQYYHTADRYKSTDCFVVYPSFPDIDIFEYKMKPFFKAYPIQLVDKRYSGMLFTIVSKNEADNSKMGETIPIVNRVLKGKDNFNVYLDKGCYYLSVIDKYKNVLYSKSVLIE